jgi:hypothetical protein
MAIAGIAALLFMSLPYAVVPLRKSLGFETHQWDADPATSHVRVLAGAATGAPFSLPPSPASPRFRALRAAPFSRGSARRGSRDRGLRTGKARPPPQPRRLPPPPAPPPAAAHVARGPQLEAHV